VILAGRLLLLGVEKQKKKKEKLKKKKGKERVRMMGRASPSRVAYAHHAYLCLMMPEASRSVLSSRLSSTLSARPGRYIPPYLLRTYRPP
jgi:hypothetical protein